MGLFTIMDINSTGLRAHRIRMEIASSNLANINTTRTPGGGPYRRLNPVFEAAPIERSDFQRELDRNLKAVGVNVKKVVQDRSDPILVYDPEHPDSDPEGYVALPNINMVEEMINLMTAARSYEANLSAINMAKQMALSAIDLAR